MLVCSYSVRLLCCENRDCKFLEFFPGVAVECWPAVKHRQRVSLPPRKLGDCGERKNRDNFLGRVPKLRPSAQRIQDDSCLAAPSPDLNKIGGALRGREIGGIGSSDHQANVALGNRRECRPVVKPWGCVDQDELAGRAKRHVEAIREGRCRLLRIAVVDRYRLPRVLECRREEERNGCLPYPTLSIGNCYRHILVSYEGMS